MVIGNSLWQHRFGADPPHHRQSHPLVRQALHGSGRWRRPDFVGSILSSTASSWVPLRELDQLLPKSSNFESRDYHWLAPIGRLREGVTQAQAAAELDLIARRLAKAHPATDKNQAFRFERAGSLPPRDASTAQMFLAALSVVVLLVLMHRLRQRRQPAAGASRRPPARNGHAACARRHAGANCCGRLLTESVLLALGGGPVRRTALRDRGDACSGRFSHPCSRSPLDTSVSVDWRVVLYTFALSLGDRTILRNLLRQMAATRPAVSNALKGEDVLGRPGRFWSLRNFLVVSQIAMSLILLCATGLFLRSMQSAASMDVGLRSEGLLMMSVDPRLHGYTAAHTTQLLTELRDRVAALPGVLSVACTDVLPLSGGNRSDGFSAEGREAPAEMPPAELFMASPGYFKTLGIPLVAGRDFQQ